MFVYWSYIQTQKYYGFWLHTYTIISHLPTFEYLSMYLFSIPGQWSGEVPTCQQIICPKIIVENPYLTLVEQNNTYGGHALFQCSWGYQLRGAADLVCQRNGSWSDAIPECNGEFGRNRTEISDSPAVLVLLLSNGIYNNWISWSADRV